MKKIKLLTLLLILSFSSCKNDDDISIIITKDTISGFVQKGPFINGTTIIISELDESINQTGNVFNTQISDNTGSFEIKNLKLNSPFVQFQANGFYFDEVIGEKSGNPLTLFALSDLSKKDRINVNVLTHLEKGRVEFLVNEGIEFSQAKDSAQQELLLAFGIDQPSIRDSEDLDIALNSFDNAILIAVSVILQSKNSVSDLTELLANINSDFRQDGVLNSESIKSKIYNNTQMLNLEEIRVNLENRYNELGLNANIPDFESIVEQYLTTQNPFDIGINVSNVSCKGLSNGSIDINVNGATEPITYLWSRVYEPNIPPDEQPYITATTEYIDSVPVGNYTVTISDANGYIIKKNIQVTEPEELRITSLIKHVSDNQEADGSVDLAIYGGTPPYSIEWSNGSTSASIESIGVGELSVSITDSNNCVLERDFWIYKIFTDSRDGNEYKTIRLGSQTWFAENIRSLVDSENNPITRFCPIDCDENGGFYTYNSAKSICPQGWRLPSDFDWRVLENHLGMTAEERLVYGYWRGTNQGNQLTIGGSSKMEIAILGYGVLENDELTFYSPTGGVYNARGTVFYWSPTENDYALDLDDPTSRKFNVNQANIWRGASPGNVTCVRCIKE